MAIEMEQKKQNTKAKEKRKAEKPLFFVHI
jgi:hypothetical protein